MSARFPTEPPNHRSDGRFDWWQHDDYGHHDWQDLQLENNLEREGQCDPYQYQYGWTDYGWFDS